MIKNFLLWVPNFPAVLARDTQPFFIPLLLLELRLTRSGTRLFSVFLGLTLFDALLNLNGYSVTAHAIWILTGAFIILLPFNAHAIRELVDKWKIYLGLVALLTVLVLVSSLDVLFTNRGDGSLNFSRSWPLIYPEPSYAAKHLFLFALVFNRLAPRPIILLALLPTLTLSATGIMLTLLLLGFFAVPRMSLGMFLRTAVVCIIALYVLSQVEISGRAGLLIATFSTLSFDDIMFLLENDQSLQTRLNWLSSDEVHFNSLLQYYRFFSLSGLLLIATLLVMHWRRRVPWYIYVENGGVLLVIGYADTFFYPFLFFVLKAAPIAVKHSCQAHSAQSRPVVHP